MNRSILLIITGILLTGCTPELIHLISAPESSDFKNSQSLDKKELKKETQTTPATSPTSSPEKDTPEKPAKPITESEIIKRDFKPFGGKIYDLNGQLINDAKVTVASLNPTVSFKETVISNNGIYLFKEGGPIGIKLVIEVAKKGYYPQKQEVILGRSAALQPTEAFNGIEAIVFNFGGSTHPGFDPNNPSSIHSSTHLQKEGTDYFLGFVYNQHGQAMENVTVKYRSLNPEVPEEGQTITNSIGQYTFFQGTMGIQIEITAEKEGYQTQNRIEVIKAGKAGDPRAHYYNFGSHNHESESDKQFALKIEHATTEFIGFVYDSQGAPMADAKVSFASLNPDVKSSATTSTDQTGQYALKGPSGVRIEITVEKEGYQTQKRIEVLKCCKVGNPKDNRYDFGSSDSKSEESQLLSLKKSE